MPMVTRRNNIPFQNYLYKTTIMDKKVFVVGHANIMTAALATLIALESKADTCMIITDPKQVTPGELPQVSIPVKNQIIELPEMVANGNAHEVDINHSVTPQRYRPTHKRS